MSQPPRCLPPVCPGLLSFRGPDAVRYLNGQLTQDVRNPDNRALPACVTDAKGKLQFYIHVFRGPDDAIWIEGPSNHAEELEARLTRYLIADDVEVGNLTGAWVLHHVIDSPEAPPEDEGFVRRAEPDRQKKGFDLWLPPAAGSPFPLLTPDEAEILRIAAGVPAWGAELVAGMLPPEAGLDRTAISYHKGCYIGQEVLSRIKTAGKVNRRLAAFHVTGDARPGDMLLLPGGDRTAGKLTSVAPASGTGGGPFPALGYLDKSAFGEKELSVAGKDIMARVIRLL